MSGQRTAMEGAAESVAAGCRLVEVPHKSSQHGLSLYVWGRGEDGQIGVGDTVDYDEPALVNINGVEQVACGSGHTTILTQDGEIYSCGRGDDGRLGHGDNGWKYVPRLVQSLASKRIAKISCGSYHTAALTSNGELYTWGGGMYGKLGHGNELGAPTPKRVEALVGMPVELVACGSRHTCVVTALGALYTWGDREQGVSGHGENTTGHEYLPRLVERLANRRIAQVSACGFHSAAVTENNELFTWGEGKFGRLGHGSERNCHSPTLVESMTGEAQVVAVSCGGFHSAVRTADGSLYTFGGGEHGQLGHNDRVNRLQPTVIAALGNIFVSQVICGWSHTVALSNEGKVYTCGNSDHGKLGHGIGVKAWVPRQVAALDPYHVVSVASYNEHTAALVEPRDLSHSRNVPVTATYSTQLRSIVNDQLYSDLTFIINGEPVYAHRAILAARSEHFSAMLRSGMRESVEGVIHVSSISKSAFVKLLEYLYADSVQIEVEDAVELYTTADLYGLEDLRDYCSNFIKTNLNVENAGLLLQASANAHCHTIKDLCLKYVVANFDAVSKTEGIKQLDHGLLLEVLASR